jgi:hypothetical protein
MALDHSRSITASCHIGDAAGGDIYPQGHKSVNEL